MNLGIFCRRWITAAGLTTLALIGADAYAATYTLLPGQGFERGWGRAERHTINFSALDTESQYVINVYNGGLQAHGLTGERVSSAVVTLNGKRLFGPRDFSRRDHLLPRPGNGKGQTKHHDRNGFGHNSKNKSHGSILGGLLNRSGNNRGSDGFCDRIDVILDLDSGDWPFDDWWSDHAPQILTKTITLHGDNELKVTLRGIPGGVITLEIIGTDDLPPSIEASVAPAANADGWHKSAATVSFSCDDGASGIAVCPEVVTVNDDGADQVITGTAVDNAGNEASASATLNIDRTLPTIAPRLDPQANGAGWNHSAVTVDFECEDALSGVAECTGPLTLSEEGGAQSAGGQVRDIAGNIASVTQSVSIDLTAPAIEASLSVPANAAGWHRADVDVHFACQDTLSGIAQCPSSVSVAVEGAGQIIARDALDLADNGNSASVTVNLDKSPPVVRAVPEPAANAAGWYMSPVTVAFDCSDNLSGVAECSAPVSVDTEGADHAVNGLGRDYAGNTRTISHALKLDLTPPEIAAELSSPANAAGWHNADVSVSFTCDDALSGVAECPAPIDVFVEAADQEVTARAVDLAGNSESAGVTVSLDKTPPDIEPVAEPAANAAGWHKSAVSVHFDCQDGLSGIADCSLPLEISEEGAEQRVDGQASDIAGNAKSASLALNIDLTSPTIEAAYTATPNSAGWYSESFTVTFTCADSLSGIDSCPEPVTLGNDVAGYALEVSTSDLAGNSAAFSNTLNLDSTAPQIAITAPEAGVELASLRPQVLLALGDNLALDAESLILTVNGQPFPGNCTVDSKRGVATCDPDSDFPRGPIQLDASVADLADNQSQAQLEFRIQEDRDGDGVPDVDDVFPDDPAEWADLDGDGIGDNSDPDRDGDGIANDYETGAGTDPDDAASTPPDLDGDAIPDSLDDDRDGDGFSNEEELQAGSDPDDPVDIPRALYVGIDGTLLATREQFIDLQGPARGENLQRLFLTSAQYDDAEFAATLSGLDYDTNDNAHWRARLPLELGDNAMVATIENSDGEQASISFTVVREERPPVIELVIDTPADNTLLTESTVVITGRVISEQAVSLPSVQVNGSSAQVSQGDGPTQFTFSSAPIVLAEGANQITASSMVSGQALEQNLTLIYQPETEQLPPPVISLRSPQPGITLREDSFTLLAEVQAEAGLATVTVNGQPATIAAGNLVQKTLDFPAGQAQISVEIEATDSLQQSSRFTAEYYRDAEAPVISVDQLQPFPVENLLTENPFRLSGTVADAALSQFSLNGQAISLEPTGTAGSYRFTVPLNIPPGPATSLVLEAVDSAGNRTSDEYLLATGSDIQLEWLTPDEGAQILLESSGQVLSAAARLSSTSGVDRVQLELLSEGQPLSPALPMQLEAGIASAQVPLPETAGNYTLRIRALDSANEQLASSSRAVVLETLEDLSLEVIKATPVDGAANVEPNGFVAVFFSRPIELDKLVLTLHESAHGFTYVDADPAGTDSLQAQGYVLQEVNRDHEAVPGVLSLLPNDTAALFYPQRDLSYNADLYLTVSYDGEELLRRHFRTRPRPTFIEGVVVDNLGQPVVNAEVALPELERTATTNSDGVFMFGYGDPADHTLPGGNYHLLVNADLKDRRFGSYTGFVNIEAGARNQVNSIQLPLLNQQIPFSHLGSGAVSVVNGGEVKLDASSASYTFGDGREQGAAHVQFLPVSSVRQPLFDPRYTPLWVYSVQPRGIAVDGQLQVEFALPKFQGTYDYAPLEGELVVLLGSSADSTRLVPVGVGQAVAGERIVGVGESHWQRLDYIAYARVIPEQWADLRAYRDGEIELNNLTLKLQTYHFVPPASKEEAAQRAAELAEVQ